MTSFRTRLAVRAAWLTSTLIKKLNRGSGVTLPGYVARLISPHILTELADQVRGPVIAVMGTNGKTTTNALLYSYLAAKGKVIINRTGANMLNGIVSAFALSAVRGGKIDADFACIEVDELSSVSVLPKLRPDAVLLTNISRDQLDRFGEVDVTYELIRKAVASVPDARLIINCDDILSYALAQDTNNPFVTYGIDEQVFDSRARSEIRESIFCRRCGSKLSYDLFHYGQLGHYHCDNCGWERPRPQHTAHHIQYENGTYRFRLDEMTLVGHVKSPYNIYNTLAACAALSALSMLQPDFALTLASFDFANNREDIFTVGSSKVQLHLAKNPIGFQQKVSLALKDRRPKDIIIQINDTYQDGEDISWLWDVDFQYLGDDSTASIITTGTRKYDMALRLRYDGVHCTWTDDIREAIRNKAVAGTGNLYVIVNYSGLYPVNRLLHELEKEDIVPLRRPEAGTGVQLERDTVVQPESGTVLQPETTKITGTAKKRLTIGHLYPDLLNLYGDRGNIRSFVNRLERRGMGAEVIPVLSGEKPDFDKFDIVLLGGGSDREQELVCGYLLENKEAFQKYVEDGGVTLAVCGGYQLLGRFYRTKERTIEGLGILDIETSWGTPRLIRNIILESPAYDRPVVGFENHGGRTEINGHTPFGKVFFGMGNTGKSGYEGVVYKNVIATYLHGPLLPKNPHVCDDLLRRALKRKYGNDVELAPLDDTLEMLANDYIANRYHDRKYVLKETIKRYT